MYLTIFRPMLHQYLSIFLLTSIVSYVQIFLELMFLSTSGHRFENEYWYLPKNGGSLHLCYTLTSNNTKSRIMNGQHDIRRYLSRSTSPKLESKDDNIKA